MGTHNAVIMNFKFNGVRYSLPTGKTARMIGVSQSTINNWLKEGMSQQDVVDRACRRRNRKTRVETVEQERTICKFLHTRLV